jgi:hypothetical protein
MIDPDNYIVVEDEVLAVPRSMNGNSIRGRVLAIEGQVFGLREFIVEVEGTHWLTDGALGLPENLFVFEVCRGDTWVSVPLYLLPNEAVAKVERSQLNTRRRIQAAVPLFASQIEVKVSSADEMMNRINGSRRETLQRDHDAALRSTNLRVQVQSLVTALEFAALTDMRSRYPRNALYGIEFWTGQLQHIHDTGHPRIFIPPSPINQSLNIPWIRPDAQVNWRSPSGPKSVRVLYIGSREVMVKILGDPITAYDPRQYPYGSTWVHPDELTPPD